MPKDEGNFFGIRTIGIGECVYFKGRLIRIKGYCRLVVGLHQYEIKGEFYPDTDIQGGLVYPYGNTKVEVLGDIHTLLADQMLEAKKIVINKTIGPTPVFAQNRYSIEYDELCPLAGIGFGQVFAGALNAGYNTFIPNPFDLGAGSPVGIRRLKLIANAQAGNPLWVNNVIAFARAEFEDFNGQLLEVIWYQHNMGQAALEFVSPVLLRRANYFELQLNVPIVVNPQAVWAFTGHGEAQLRNAYVE